MPSEVKKPTKSNRELELEVDTLFEAAKSLAAAVELLLRGAIETRIRLEVLEEEKKEMSINARGKVEVRDETGKIVGEQG